MDKKHSKSTFPTNNIKDHFLHIGVYSALSIGEAIVMSVRDLIFFLRCALASKLIHNALLDGVLKSPMSFFDTNPLGRIINRFSADIDTLGWARVKSKLGLKLQFRGTLFA